MPEPEAKEALHTHQSTGHSEQFKTSTGRTVHFLSHTHYTPYPTNTGHTVLFIKNTGRTVLFLSHTHYS